MSLCIKKVRVIGCCLKIVRGLIVVWKFSKIIWNDYFQKKKVHHGYQNSRVFLFPYSVVSFISKLLIFSPEEHVILFLKLPVRAFTSSN